MLAISASRDGNLALALFGGTAVVLAISAAIIEFQRRYTAFQVPRSGQNIASSGFAEYRLWIDAMELEQAVTEQSIPTLIVQLLRGTSLRCCNIELLSSMKTSRRAIEGVAKPPTKIFSNLYVVKSLNKALFDGLILFGELFFIRALNA